MKTIMESWRNFTELDDQPTVKVFLDMDGVLVNFTAGLVQVLNEDIGGDVEYSRSRGKALRKLKAYQGPDKVFPITKEFMRELLEKKDSQQQLSQWELLVKRYQFKPISKNYEHWVKLPKAPGADALIQGCFDLIGEENVYILSAPVDDESVKAKYAWLAEHTPIPKERIIIRLEKGTVPPMFPGERCILIDDREKYQAMFQAGGGEGILHAPEASMAGVQNSLAELKSML